MHHQTFKKTILFLYVALIATLSLLPPSDLPKINVFPYFDKLVHLCMYAGLSFLLLWLWEEKTHKSKYGWVLLILFGWGLLMEIIQGISHLGRSFDVLDIIANVLGFIPGLGAWWVLQRGRKKIVKSEE